MKYSISLVAVVLAVNLMLCEAGCYNSGQWGKLDDMRTAVDKFNEHYHGHAICGAQSLQWVVDAGRDNNGNDYHYVLEIRRDDGKSCEVVGPSHMDSLAQKIRNNCAGQNRDTQGGNFDLGAGWSGKIDPNAG